MADPLSVTAGIIAVAGLAYSSTKALYQLISSIRDAPTAFQDLNQRIVALSEIMNTLKTDLDGCRLGPSESQIACLQVAKPTLDGCDRACKNFKTKMEGLPALFQDGKKSFPDSFKLKLTKTSQIFGQEWLVGS